MKMQQSGGTNALYPPSEIRIFGEYSHQEKNRMISGELADASLIGFNGHNIYNHG